MRWAATCAALCRPRSACRRAEHGLLVWNPREALLRDWQRVEPRLDELEGHMELLALLPWCRSESPLFGSVLMDVSYLINQKRFAFSISVL